MFASLFASAFLATVMAQSVSTDNSPITTVTLAASAILPPATTSASAVVPTVTNTMAAVTTITVSGTSLPAGVQTSPAASSQVTVLLTSTITSTLCGACTTPTGAVTVAPVATSIRPSSSVVTVSRNATGSGVPYGGSNIFPVNQGTTLANGTIAYSAASNLPGAGSIAISAGVLAASYFAFVL